MMYPFMTLDDGAEIVHSETKPDGSVKVYVEKPDEQDCFHQEMDRYLEMIRSTAHLIKEFAADGGFENASGL